MMLRALTRKVDLYLFDGALMKRRKDWKEYRYLFPIQSQLDSKILNFYSKNRNSELSKLCDRYGSDKGTVRHGSGPYPWPSHTYADFYERLFAHCRMHIKTVFECGLGTNNIDIPSSMGAAGKPGASLRVWRDYFASASIYGADIDRDILFQDDRIQTAFIDQCDPKAIQSYWNWVGNIEFDIMIDDGLHTFEGGSVLFLHSINKLAASGIYIIEDVTHADMILFKEFFQDKPYWVDYICLFGPSTSLNDNNLIVIRKLI